MKVREFKIVLCSLAVAGLVAAAGYAAEPKAVPAAGAKVVATVNGAPITQAEVEAKAAEQLQQMEEARLRLLSSTTEALVIDKLLDLEAAAKGVTREALLDAEVKAKIPAITDAEADLFYEQNRARIQQPKEQVMPQIKQYLAQQKQGAVYTSLIESLNTKYKVENFLKAEVEAAQKKLEDAKAAAEALKAPETRAKVENKTSPAKGAEAAPVVLVEFSDFQCPFCSRVVPAIHEVSKKYGDKVRVVFRQFPLNSIHPLAQKAAEASLCAQDQSKFWEMHDAMFADQAGLGVDALKAKAQTLGLDAAKFGECLDSGQKAAEVAADLAAGTSAGVNSTPAIFVNGRLISGAQPFEAIAKMIDQELERASKGK
jgi:protein-disulfide isomerase